MVRADAGCDGDLELLGLGETLSAQVTGVEAVVCQSTIRGARLGNILRSGDDDLGVNELLVKGRVLAVLVRGRHQGVTLILEPLADAKLILSGSEEFGNLGSSSQPNPFSGDMLTGHRAPPCAPQAGRVGSSAKTATAGLRGISTSPKSPNQPLQSCNGDAGSSTIPRIVPDITTTPAGGLLPFPIGQREERLKGKDVSPAQRARRRRKEQAEL